MPRKHNNDEMEEIGKKVEEYLSSKGYQFTLNFWNILFEDRISDPSVQEVANEIGISPKKLSEWYWWDCFKNICGCGSI